MTRMLIRLMRWAFTASDWLEQLGERLEDAACHTKTTTAQDDRGGSA